MDDPALYHDELLEHTPALEQLSYYLTREEQSADDLVQETMITALERPPRHRENLGGWLHTVARNLALRGHRTKRRRERRETEAAQPESFKALDPAREEIMERVTRAVEELNEPYRTVIQMRFFDEMPPREIAAALTRPVKTVKSQLHRGLARLRIVLEKEFGDDEEIWAASLLALILPNAKTPPVAALAAEEASTSAWTSVTWTLGGVAAALALVLIPLALRQSPRAIEPLARAASGATANLSPTDLALTPTAEKQMVATNTLAPIAPVQRKTQQVEAIDRFGQPLRGGLVEIYRASGEFEAVGRTNEAGLLTFEVDEADYLQPLDFHDERPLPQELHEPSLG
ncbi:MAG: RNA polymerase sigma factor, partial [Planctomycetota bacterium]